MKTIKSISLTLNIPAEYRYMARQPWGALVLFKARPTVYKGVEDWGKGPESVSYWQLQEGEVEIELFDELNRDSNWENSIVEL